MTNEDLCELGPYAYILFIGLWMIADKEGRLEDRPKRIKALAMPLWSNAEIAGGKPVDNPVENLLKSLAEKGFIVRYRYGADPFIKILNWDKYQNIHPREPASVIPPEPVKPSRSASYRATAEAVPRHVQGNAEATAKSPLTSFTSSTSLSSAPLRSADERARASAPRPPSPPAGTETDPDPDPEPGRKPPNRERTTERTTRTESRPAASSSPESFWPHKPEDVLLLRAALDTLARDLRMPRADNEILRQVLDAGAGLVTAAEIHATLRVMHQRRKFDAIYSWGLVPRVIKGALRSVA